MNDIIKEAVQLIKSSTKITIFSGAGISVESGIPPFRGETGLWSKYDPICLDLSYYYSNTQQAWDVIKEIFYDFFGEAKPNMAHKILGEMEKAGFVQAVITQNIDNLHQEGGSKNVIEFHGNSQFFIDTVTREKYPIEQVEIGVKPPISKKGNLLKPDFIFFGEGIPPNAYSQSEELANTSDLFILIGTTGEIMPASMIPYTAKRNGAKIIEINPEKSNYTNQITDVYIPEKASLALSLIWEEIKKAREI